MVGRGEVWWLETPDEKGRPVLVVSRDAANAAMQRVLVAPVTRTLRSAPSQLRLGSDEGLYTECAANFDDLMAVPKSMLIRRLGSLGARLPELCAALAVVADC